MVCVSFLFEIFVVSVMVCLRFLRFIRYLMVSVKILFLIGGDKVEEFLIIFRNIL